MKGVRISRRSVFDPNQALVVRNERGEIPLLPPRILWVLPLVDFDCDWQREWKDATIGVHQALVRVQARRERQRANRCAADEGIAGEADTFSIRRFRFRCSTRQELGHDPGRKWGGASCREMKMMISYWAARRSGPTTSGTAIRAAKWRKPPPP